MTHAAQLKLCRICFEPGTSMPDAFTASTE